MELFPSHAQVRKSIQLFFLILIQILNVELNQEEIEERLRLVEPFQPRIKEGFLGKTYARLVDSVDRGAVLRAK